MKAKIYSCIVVLLLSLYACSDDDNNVNGPGQLFRPAMFQISVGMNETKLTWIPMKGANYLIEVSRDSLLFETDVQSYEVADTTAYLLENLLSNTRYSARIKCISQDPNVKDSEYNTGTFVTQQENLFYSFEPGAITPYGASLHWDSLKVVTHVEISTEGVDVIKLPLSSWEKEHGRKEIENLTPGTSYTFSIYNNEIFRGSLTASTLKEDIFDEVLPEDIGTNNILLKWDNSRAVTKIVISRAGASDNSITLTSGEIAEGKKNITGLMPGTAYTFKICDREISRGEISVTTKKENIFFEPASGDIGSNRVMVKWNSTPDVTHIIVLKGGTEDIRLVDLTGDDISAAQKDINELLPNTNYEIRIYNNSQVRGLISVKTLN